MLHFFVTKRGVHTLDTYLSDWAGKLRKCISVHLYEDENWPAAIPGTYIFIDHERMSPEQLESAANYAKKLQLSGVDLRILNSPDKVLRRLDLLNEMSRIGINRFRAFRLREISEDFRFPGFLRKEGDHKGPISSLLQNREELDNASNQMLASGADVEDILAIEFCDTLSADGYYRKYSYYKFADTIISAHIIFSKDWVTKDGASTEEQTLEQDIFHSQNPHLSWVRGIFEAAGIDYGRIDYGICPDGTPQVWEINTNPILLASRARYEKKSPLDLPRKELLALQLAEVFKSFLPADSNCLDTLPKRLISNLKKLFRMIK